MGEKVLPGGASDADPRSSASSVLIADDHPATRAGVRAALERGGFFVCAEVGDAPAALSAALEERPDICLLDVHMPGNGLVAAAEIAAKLPETAVVMLTVLRDDETLFAALRAGASGYLLKDTDPERLPDALWGVLRGEAALPRTLVARVLDEFRGRNNARVADQDGRMTRLTSREWEVLELLCEGLSTAQVAERLFVSRGTVRSHIASIIKKLKVTDRAEAVRLAQATID